MSKDEFFFRCNIQHKNKFRLMSTSGRNESQIPDLVLNLSGIPNRMTPVSLYLNENLKILRSQEIGLTFKRTI